MGGFLTLKPCFPDVGAFDPCITGRQKGGFVKAWFWRMCPRSGFRFGGTCERTLVPVFVPGEHPNVPSFRFSFRGNMRTYPRSGFRSGGTSECTLVPVFVPGEHPPKPRFWKTTLRHVESRLTTSISLEKFNLDLYQDDGRGG